MDEACGSAVDNMEMEDVVEIDREQWKGLADRCDELVDTLNEQYGEPVKPEQHGPRTVVPPQEPTKA